MSETFELELDEHEVAALRGVVHSYRQHFLPAGDGPKDKLVETLIAEIHNKLRDIDLPEEENVEKGETGGK